VPTRPSPLAGAALCLVAASLCARNPAAGRQTAQEPSPVFSSDTKLVLVPFHVARDAHFVRDIKPEDVVLLQDGKPREFTVFEGPGTQGRREPVELTVLFDATTLSEVESKSGGRFTSWNREAAYAWVGKWTDKQSRALRLTGIANVLISIYRFDHRQLQQLCRLASDPGVITDAIHRLTEPIPPAEAIPLTLPPNRMTIRDLVVKQGGFKEDPKHPVILHTPSWTLEAAITTLKDSFAEPGRATRLLAVFSQGGGPTNTTAEDVADRANALGIPVYPILLGRYQAAIMGTRPAGAGSDASARGCDPRNIEQGLTCQDGDSIQLEWVARVGKLTGGRAFYPGGMDEKLVSDILVVVRNEGLFQYVVGFAPEPAGRPRNHTLEVKLKSKASGELRGGKRPAKY
jgi:hypothetical protein